MIESDFTVGGVRRGDDATRVSVAAMVEDLVGCKWSVQLLGLIGEGCSRPSALLRAVPGLSAKVMNERLGKMMRFGIVQRSVRGVKPPLEVDYTLTPFGLRFMRIIDEVRRLQASVDGGMVAFSGDDHSFDRANVGATNPDEAG